jgi:hypothetical protein
MTKKLLALASAMQVEFETGPKFRSEYQYQSTRTGAEEIFEDGGEYYCIQKERPRTEVDGAWVRHPDQMWVEFYKCPPGLTIWVSDAEYGARLAAAAPDLLDALRKIVEATVDGEKVNAIARAAINKVEQGE